MPEYKQFPLADTAEGLTEAEILNWRVKPGDEVRVNQIVVEIETAKAAVELPIPWSGVVTELLAEPGQTVEVGTPIMTVDVDPGGDSAGPGPANNGSVKVEPAAPATPAAAAEEEMKPLVGYGSKAVSAKRRPRKAVASQGADTVAAQVADPAVAATNTHVPLAKPPVRKLAKELGVDLRTVPGSADGGVITREDVRRAAQPRPAPAAAPSGARERRVPVRGVRKATAQAMVDSAFSAPHVTEFLTVDVTPMMTLREKLKTTPEFSAVKLTPLAFAAKAVCLAVRRTPDVNAVWDEQAAEIVYKDYVHLGIAAATPRGLVVPKVRDADAMSLAELAAAIEALTSTAKEGKTPPEDMLGGTFTITNVGVFGVDTGTPIINPGESAILALGAIRDMPWVVDGELAVRKVLQLSLSFDHRVVDGQQGSQFLADVGALLSDPATAITY
ncbi:pyruvate/2-oxoglutarate dehydrogenase complex, dihydrolipoamide acyltransferase component [Saccharomonospora marina XMU15]|uniref:Dihydrolipoamide acetyltransferase component of pyruvate dehydrogenase complex n=1 Tax=Saccharomonospora marina XMU15 TaxID=882083 RepID=H5XC05_9PSEU|nr:dihydrolipoamide acetyltransferase family protein [Saccharomonospora marina]EHR53809.1 pyruvate/2-oxoglutarate dehydrogenase complex, dihydrolipoamide acyltransferase component [Saccharomonospora marina XMU15]